MSLLSSAALAQGAKPTDPQISHIAYTAGVIDTAAAKQALAKTRNKEIKAFAEDMVRDGREQAGPGSGKKSSR